MLNRLAEVGLIDDGAFAEAWVDSRHAGRGLAPRALRHELATRGVEAAVVARAVGVIDPQAELAMERQLVKRRLPRLELLPREVQVRRLAGMLARKGYSPATSGRAIREALAGRVGEVGEGGDGENPDYGLDRHGDDDAYDDVAGDRE